MNNRLRSCIAILAMFGSVSAAADAKSAVGLQQMKQASEIGASCTGFYDGVYALLHRMQKDADSAGLEQLKMVWPGIDQSSVFRQSTASMLMTDIFIAKINQSFDVDPPMTLQNFSQQYVESRKSTMDWKHSITGNAILERMRDQCEQIIRISVERGTLREGMLNKAIKQRARALGIEVDGV
ncbi:MULTISPECIES: hypothetical protein [Neptunomonas]|uniref:Uncharacterized protein n=1 Tax=Neptunomonas marina TaxID=1815562 RepID=A0A437QE51_9GAMM|nr:MULTISPECIES: hypothetical protein [Neptunomonas]RVU32817.1 hypothetical protein EOE65_03950 [Neptunomonas marina]